MRQTPNGISIGSAVFAQLFRVTNTQTDRHTHTDHATCEVCSNKSHLRTACRRCGLIMVLEKCKISPSADVTYASDYLVSLGRECGKNPDHSSNKPIPLRYLFLESAQQRIYKQAFVISVQTLSDYRQLTEFVHSQSTTEVPAFEINFNLFTPVYVLRLFHNTASSANKQHFQKIARTGLTVDSSQLWRFCQVESHVTQKLGQIKNPARPNLDTVPYFKNPWSVASSHCKWQRRQLLKMKGCPTLRGSWPWPWHWIGSYCIPSCITHRPLLTGQISLKSKKLFVDGRTVGWTFETGFIRPKVYSNGILHSQKRETTKT